MPLPENHSLAASQWLVDDTTGQRLWYCNCNSQPPTRTLRWAARNRARLSLPPQTIKEPPAAAPLMTIKEPAPLPGPAARAVPASTSVKASER